MKVKELIEELNKANPDSNIIYADDMGGVSPTYVVYDDENKTYIMI